MAVKQKNARSVTKKKQRPAITPEARENQLISAAYDLVEERILNGTATSQEVCHFLKLGSTKTRLENEILELQKELVSAKTENLKSAKRIEDLYANALNAMRTYGGKKDENI